MTLGDLAREVLQALLRFVPWPVEPGVRAVGEPGPLSPVLVTGNYDLTVRRVLRALRGQDVWLVVAPSGGINVWCAASGGHLSTHQVVTALKTSGVEDRVRHRRAILPQLAATGVQAREVSRRCSWRVRFGPVYAHDLPRYLAADAEKSDDMRHVRFGWVERLEMAAAWAGPTALVLALVAAFVRPEWMLAGVTLCALQGIAVFLVYDRLPSPRRWVFGAAAALLAAVAAGAVGAESSAIGAAVLASAGITVLLTFDYPGSTPIEGGSHFQEARWRIALDLERCQGVYRCWEVCPEACFEKREDVRKVELAHEERCVRCGACVVQCPLDALAFEDEAKHRVEPDTIRRYKLNLMGKRAVASPDEPAA
jgi:NAD-dependent dihydropyrimidine dehydrogenase PreA subunit